MSSTCSSASDLTPQVSEDACSAARDQQIMSGRRLVSPDPPLRGTYAASGGWAEGSGATVSRPDPLQHGDGLDFDQELRCGER